MTGAAWMRDTATPQIEHSGYHLAHCGTLPPCAHPPPGPPTRLLQPGTDGGGILVRTATVEGPVEVTVETFVRGVEVPVACGAWDVEEEVTATATGHDVRVVTTFGEIEGMPVLRIAPGQRYRVRIYARGLDAARSVLRIEADEEPVEHHLVQMWPL